VKYLSSKQPPVYPDWRLLYSVRHHRVNPIRLVNRESYLLRQAGGAGEAGEAGEAGVEKKGLSEPY
jgi:hypothetical protein